MKFKLKKMDFQQKSTFIKIKIKIKIEIKDFIIFKIYR